MASFGKRLQHAWNAFRNNRDPTDYMGAVYSNNPYSTPDPKIFGYISNSRPDRVRLTRGNERSIITAIYNRIAVDAASVEIRHVRLDKNGRYVETLKTGLNNCLTLEANMDQTGRQFIQDAVMSMLDEGCVALLPTETDVENPFIEGSFDILSMRTAKITQWAPEWVECQFYNQVTGQKSKKKFPKHMVAIVENPFYAVMNEPIATLTRLIRKLNLKDLIDERSGSSKLNLLFQLPYTVKTDLRMQEAEKRKKKLTEQLVDDPYGIAYIDATEKVTQLNRPLENNLLEQIRDLTGQLYTILGLTPEIMNGTADEKTMLNYYNRTIEVVLSALTKEMERKFLTKYGRTQGQAIRFYQDHFRLMSVNNIADIADKFIRNEIMTANEIRSKLGMLPSDDPKADELRNPNMPQQEDSGVPGQEEAPEEPVDPEELEKAKQTLLKAGLSEKDLSELTDAEIVELAERYKNGDLGEDEEEAPMANTG